ncbi:MAG TPA: hypothetical protein VMI32_13020 [Candidatus Solibacter sp.]|nr:hypothetical protein [Candidatus Solibacter sp.]
MATRDSYDEDFDSIFNSNSNSDSGSGGLTAADVERIATNTFVRGYQALQQGVALVQGLTSEAIRKTEEAHPGFVERYRNPELCKKFIDQRPAVARAILNAESGQGTESLGELYEIFDETARTYEQPENRGLTPGQASGSGSASILSLTQINSLPLEQRREHIAALGDRVADVPLDDADPNNQVFRIERGE